MSVASTDNPGFEFLVHVHGWTLERLRIPDRFAEAFLWQDSG
jgi:hypothetical protein